MENSLAGPQKCQHMTQQFHSQVYIPRGIENMCPYTHTNLYTVFTVTLFISVENIEPKECSSIDERRNKK